MHASGQRVWSVAAKHDGGHFPRRGPTRGENAEDKGPGSVEQPHGASSKRQTWDPTTGQKGRGSPAECSFSHARPTGQTLCYQRPCAKADARGDIRHRTVIFMEMPTTPRGQEANHTDIKPNPGTGFEMHKPSRVSTREATRMDSGPRMKDKGRWNRPRTG